MISSMMRRMAVLGLVATALLPGAAQAQKKLVVYTSNENTLNDLVFGAFTKETGIAVEPVVAGSGVVVRRLQAEKDRPLGDIIWGVSRSLLQTNKALLAPYASKNKDAIPVEYRDPTDLWIGNNLHLLVILQNTKILPADQGPKGWSDLLDPKWKGKIMWIDPRTSGFTAGPMTAIRLKYGEDTVKRLLVDQQPAFSRDNRQITEGLLRGTYALATGVTQPVLDQFLQQGLGKNVKFVDIVDFATTGSGDGLWMMNRAPHPNATKLFVNWALTKAGQESYSKTVAGNSRRADVAPATPERLPRQGQTYFRNLESTVPEVVKTRAFIATLLGNA